MKRLKLFFACLLMAVLSIGQVWGADQVYSGTVAKVDANGDQTMNGVAWTITSDNTSGLGQQVNASKGAQIGSGSKPTKALTFETTGIEGTIKQVVVNTSGASGFSGTVSVTVGSTAFLCGTETTASVGTSAADYTFKGEATGKITISWAQTSSKAIYVKTISVTYGEASSCTSEITITKADDPANGTFALDNSGTVCVDDEDATVTVTATPDAHYHLATVTSTVGTIGTISGNTCEITDIDADTEIGVTFAEDDKVKVTWNVNGDETLKTDVYVGEKPAFPATPSSCSTSSTTFIGWATAPWTGKADDLSEKTVYTSASAMPEVNTAVTYYAVFARVTALATNLFSWAGGKSADLSALEGVTLSGGGDYADAHSPYYVKFNGDGKYVTIALASQPGKVTFGVKKVGGAKTCAMKVQEADDADGAFTDVEEIEIAGASNAILDLETSQSFKSSTRAVKLYFAKGDGDNVGLGPISIESPVSYADYLTTCGCEKLGTPSVTVPAANLTHNSAKLTWAAVDNADKYLVKINGVDQEATSNLYFDATGLTPETQYTYQVKALPAANQDDYCEGDFSEEANFTTDEAPKAHLTLIDIEGTHASSGDYAVGIPFNLPTTAASCSKTFVGWTSKDDFADGDESETSYYAKGAPFTFADQTGVTLYAVYATAANVTATFNAGEYAGANNWQNGTAYSGFKIDGVTFTAVGGGNNGKYYTSDATWRFYDGGGSVSVSAAGNILSVSSNPSMTFTINGTSASAAGAAKYKSITVTAEGSYSNYSTTCVEQLAEPTFTLDEGEYATTDKTVKIQATNEAAIYYSLDGTTPAIDAEHLYDGNAIALNARGAYNFKAIAVKAGFENSDVAEAEYKINPPFESVADLFSYVGNNTTYNLGQVTVTGYVSEIVTEYSSQHDNVSYNISDDGKTTSAQLQSYRGKGVKTGEDVYEDADLVAVGDKVTIKGTYKVFGSSNTKELDANNYIITRVAKGNIASLAVSGTADKTEYSNGEDFLFGGLVATATYESGYAEEITPDSWAADPATVTATGNVAVTATVGAVTSPAYPVAVTVSEKELLSIAVGTASYTIYTSQALPKPTVTATYSEGEPEDVSASAIYDTESVFDTNTPNEYTITVSYTFGGETKTATYTVTVKDYANANDAPYTVTEALDIIIDVIGSTKSAKEIVVAGTVSEENISSYKNRYKISDGVNELLVYNGNGFNGKSFTNNNYPKVGDVMVVKGKVINYGGNTPEFATGESYLLSQIRPATLAIEDVTGFEVGAENIEVADLTIDQVGNGVVTLASSSNTAYVEIVEGKLHAVAPGTATITANLAATTNEDALNYSATTATFDVEVIATITKYAITFDGNGNTGGDAPEAIANQAENAEVTLPANTYTKDGYKFDGWKVINNTTSEEVSHTGNTFIMPASAVTLQATWEIISPWAYVYDNNVVVAHTGSGTDDGTITISETVYKLVKAGAGSNTGTIKVTVPAGATDLHFHAFAWGGKTAKIQIAGVDNPSISEFELAGESGASGSGNDFTLQSVPVDQYFHVSFDAVAAETEIVFSKATGSADNRFFFYGVNQVGGDFGSYQRNVTSGNYGTICLPQAGTISGATLFEIANYENDMIYVDEILSGKMEAGRPYIFQATAGQLNVTYTSGIVVDEAGNANGLYGFYDLDDDEAKFNITEDAGNYILYQNAYWLVSGRAAYIANYRAYIKLNQINNTGNQAPGRRRVAMTVHGEQNATGMENVQGDNVQCTKVLIDGNIYILRGEKMYDATGRLVK